MVGRRKKRRKTNGDHQFRRVGGATGAGAGRVFQACRRLLSPGLMALRSSPLFLSLLTLFLSRNFTDRLFSPFFLLSPGFRNGRAFLLSLSPSPFLSSFGVQPGRGEETTVHRTPRSGIKVGRPRDEERRKNSSRRSMIISDSTFAKR